MRVALWSLGPAIAAWIAYASLFTVDVTQFGVVTRFGAVVRVVAQPGLHLKVPFDSVLRLDRRLTFSRPAPAEYLTVDKRNVVVESLATWRIGDPQRYLETLATRADADAGLGDVLLGQIGSVVGTHPAASLIAPDGNADRFQSIVSQIRERVAAYAGPTYGIEVVDVKLLHLTLPQQNREPVFERMKAERGKIAKEYRTAGELASRKIIAEADRERTRIEAEAYAKAQRFRGEGDAEASRIYAAAYGRNPRFYKFLRNLRAYEKFFDDSTTVFLPADAEVLRVLRPSGRQAGAQERAPLITTSKPLLAEPGPPVSGPRAASGSGADQANQSGATKK